MPTSTTGSSPWQFLDRDITPFGISAVASSAAAVVGSSVSPGWQVDVTADDPTRTYPNPVLPASAPVTVFSASAISGIAYSTLATVSGMITQPIAALRLTILSATAANVGQVVLTYLEGETKQ
jgi:hypothetical protein